MKFFGTDGIRGNSNLFPFDNYTLNVIGKAIAETLKGKNNKILIIRDTRESGKRIEKALAEGVLSSKGKVVFGGVMPTAAASLLLQKNKYLASIVISASHNPYNDNGIKIFNSKGSKLSDSVEKKIENRITKYLNKKIKFCNKKFPQKEDLKLIKVYEKFIIKTFGNKKLRNKKIVIDCANGASFKCAPRILKSIGAKIIVLNANPNGKNINLKCGALNPEYVSVAVKKNKAFCGFAFDGDADRLICVDEKGIIRDGDFFLASMAKHLKSKNKLKNNILVTTVMANIGLIKAMKEAGIKAITSKVGDRYVLEDMKKYNASLGGEQSGHFIFKDLLGTGDGILSAVQMLKALNEEDKSLSEFVSIIQKFPQVLINKEVKKKIAVEKLPNSKKLIKKYEKELGDYGRILVRYSGTENLLRVMVEGKELLKIKKIASDIANSMDKEIKEKI